MRCVRFPRVRLIRLRGSKYTLCPRGFNHVDSFRIYEALMAGWKLT